MKRKFLFALLMACVGLMLASCDKEEGFSAIQSSSEQVSPEVVTYGEYTGSPWVEYRKSPKLSKSFLVDYSDPDCDELFSTAVEYPFTSTARQYSVMKVERKSEPGKYFWVMIENFAYKNGDSSYVYGNNEANAAIYGRMYHWSIAKECENKVRMRLPRRRADGTYTAAKFPTYGHLPTRQDINDICEVESIGHLPSNGTTIYNLDPTGNYYYDVFISGRDLDEDMNPESAYHTLGGWLDNTDYYWLSNRDYCDINENVFFWTNDGIDWIDDSHYPLEIDYEGGEYSAFINALHADNYGFYVRYVFEPMQL